MNGFIPVNEPDLSGNEKKYLCECIETGWISSEGPFVRKFEEEFSKKVDRKYGISVTNGTAALEIAVRALGISEGDEVIMPTFTIISCAEAVTRVGGIPILVDSDSDTWNMRVDQIEERITPRTKAIMVVHIYGLPVDMDTVLDIANRYNLKIIEDAAEMHGQTYNGRPCGSFGDVSTFSFYPNKHITTGEGGMIVTDDELIAERCMSLRNLCFQKEVRYVHEELSGNYRFTNLQAAVGLAQLERLDEFVERKRQMGRKYTDLLKSLKGIQLPIQFQGNILNIYWVYGIVLGDELPFDNRTFVKKLGEKGVGARTFFWCIHEQPFYQKRGFYKNEKYPIAERLARKGLYIPSGLALKDEQMDIVANTIKQILSET